MIRIRPSRVVLMPRRWHQLATMLCIALAMVTRKPDHQGARNRPLKPFAQGMPDVSGEPVVD
jgi:hypothetical protein